MARQQRNQVIRDSRDPDYVELPEREEDEELPYWVKFEEEYRYGECDYEHQ